MRAVPSNCSQYEICINNKWKLQNCKNFYYFNAEEQSCLEPRDDAVCKYAHVSGLPPCNSTMEYHTLWSNRNSENICSYYYQCLKGKWLLKSCGKSQYYDDNLNTCMESSLKNACKSLDMKKQQLDKKRACRHTAIDYYEADCAMYKMCIESEWWLQYCPLGMYFNRTLKYCVPNQGECASATLNVEEEEEEKEQIKFCKKEGNRRAWAEACNGYEECQNGMWMRKICAEGEYFEASSRQCLKDDLEQCKNLQLAKPICIAGQRRAYPLNCNAFEECSENGFAWQKQYCEQHEAFDVLMANCLPNTDGSCSKNGLRKACWPGEIKAYTGKECNLFQYCDKDAWRTAACLTGQMFSNETLSCTPHAANNQCLPAIKLMSMQANDADSLCQNAADGAMLADPTDCSSFVVCLQNKVISQQRCPLGSYFNATSSYCVPNEGNCQVPLSGVCENATLNTLIPHEDDCTAYYNCSMIGTLLQHCPDGQYFHKITKQCRIDHGICKAPQELSKNKCEGLPPGTRLAHEAYCNIYYSCLKGKAIPIECPDDYWFNDILGVCIADEQQHCQLGLLVSGNQSNCAAYAAGSYLPHRFNCRKYYICGQNSEATEQKCSKGNYFNAEQGLCLPDDGSCSIPNDAEDDDDEPQHHPVPPDPVVCIGKHGYLMPDPANCNNFYVCINGKLRRERCYNNHFFNHTTYQCQMLANGTAADSSNTQTKAQCSDPKLNSTEICALIADGSIADQSDCRRYITCENGMELNTERCRNGESYDSILGFCRQSEGTCSMENGLRVGECSGKHGQLVRDAENCRGYFVCINAQKIQTNCSDNEYFNAALGMCQPNILGQCTDAVVASMVDMQYCSC